MVPWLFKRFGDFGAGSGHREDLGVRQSHFFGQPMCLQGYAITGS